MPGLAFNLCKLIQWFRGITYRPPLHSPPSVCLSLSLCGSWCVLNYVRPSCNCMTSLSTCTHIHRRMHIKHFWLCRLVPVAFAVCVSAASLFSVWYQNAFMFSFVIKSVILAARTWQRAGQGRTGGVATDISMQMYALEWASVEW